MTEAIQQCAAQNQVPVHLVVARFRDYFAAEPAALSVTGDWGTIAKSDLPPVSTTHWDPTVVGLDDPLEYCGVDGYAVRYVTGALSLATSFEAAMEMRSASQAAGVDAEIVTTHVAKRPPYASYPNSWD